MISKNKNHSMGKKANKQTKPNNLMHIPSECLVHACIILLCFSRALQSCLDIEASRSELC